MTDLTSKHRARLRALAHPLKPVLQIGQDGVSEAFLDSLRQAFNTRELLKVKVLDNAPLNATEAADAIVAGMEDVAVPQVIGRTVVLYRPDPEEPEIELA